MAFTEHFSSTKKKFVLTFYEFFSCLTNVNEIKWLMIKGADDLNTKGPILKLQVDCLSINCHPSFVVNNQYRSDETGALLFSSHMVNQFCFFNFQ